MKMKIATVLAATVACTVLSQATAEEMSLSGTMSFEYLSSEPIAGAPGRMVRSEVSGTLMVAGETAPFHGATHICNSTTMLDEDDQTTAAAGSCTSIDADKEVWVLSFVSEKGGGSTWTVTWGNGKYAGMTGSGTTTYVSERPDGLDITWEGTFEMK